MAACFDQLANKLNLVKTRAPENANAKPKRETICEKKLIKKIDLIKAVD